jgi:hypothetical protein
MRVPVSFPNAHYYELYQYRQPLAASFVNIGYRCEIDKDENGELLGTIIKQHCRTSR